MGTREDIARIVRPASTRQVRKEVRRAPSVVQATTQISIQQMEIRQRLHRLLAKRVHLDGMAKKRTSPILMAGVSTTAAGVVQLVGTRDPVELSIAPSVRMDRPRQEAEG